MKRNLITFFTVAAAVLFLSVTVLQVTAEARIGGGRSMGSRGSRSYSSPMQTPSRQATTPVPGGYQQQGGGGFMRSMAGGMAGGMLGSMLFSGMAGAGNGTGTGTGGGGIGLFEIILLAGGGFLIYRMLQKGRG